MTQLEHHITVGALIAVLGILGAHLWQKHLDRKGPPRA